MFVGQFKIINRCTRKSLALLVIIDTFVILQAKQNIRALKLRINNVFLDFNRSVDLFFRRSDWACRNEVNLFRAIISKKYSVFG